MTETIERLRYFQRQYLGAVDFEDEQAYHRDMRRRHNLGLHTWGIVTGLELEERTPVGGGSGPLEIWIRPGMAIDGYGREIVLLEPLQLQPDPRLFGGLTTSGYVPVWLLYNEERARRPAPGYEQCDDGDQLTRVLERYRLLVGPQLTEHGPVIVAGRQATTSETNPVSSQAGISVPRDESVPHQDFPDEEEGPARWPVRLGSVNWDGRPGRGELLPNDSARLNEERRYVGGVAATIYGPAGRVHIRRRWQLPSLQPDEEPADLAVVHGPLRIEGERTAIRLIGGKLDFRSADATADPRLEVYRQDGEGLRVRLGHESTGATRFAVGIDTGPIDAPAFEQKFSVDDEGDVLIRRNATVGAGANGLLKVRHIDGKDFDSDDNDHLYLNWATGKDVHVGGSDPAVRSGLHVHGDSIVGAGANGALRVRHVDGKRADNDNFDNLYLNWGTSTNVYVGGLTRSQLLVYGDATVGAGGNGALKARHVDGKHFVTDDFDDLHLNWGTGKRVWVGSPGAPAPMTVTGDLTVNGSILTGSTNQLVKVRTQTFSVKNEDVNNAGEWTYNHIGQFSEIYARFVALQGYGLWDMSGNTNWDPVGGTVAVSVPQCFVRITGGNLNYTWGISFAKETIGGFEPDNSVLFTVVIIGRGV